MLLLLQKDTVDTELLLTPIFTNSSVCLLCFALIGIINHDKRHVQQCSNVHYTFVSYQTLGLMLHVTKITSIDAFLSVNKSLNSLIRRST